MIDLNNKEELEKLDPKDALGSTDLLVQQCEAAWNEVVRLELPKHIDEVENVVFCGMGASINGALVLKALLGRNMPFPSECVSDYFLPDYVGKNSLVVLTSYSGTTEEVLSCAEDAKAKEAKMIILTKGGTLAEFAKDNNVPAYIFDGSHNPSGVARLGNGYSILGLMGLLNRTGVIDIEEHEVTNAIGRLKEKVEDIKNQAKADLPAIYNKMPVILSAEHLSGNAQIMRNQINENSKTFSAFYLIPDLNHHLLEGLAFPQPSPAKFVVLNSPNYSDKIRKRIELTIDVIKKNNHEVHVFNTSGQTVYDDFLEALVYSSYLSIYLGLAYGQDPSGNPWVDYFKKLLNS